MKRVVMYFLLSVIIQLCLADDIQKPVLVPVESDFPMMKSINHSYRTPAPQVSISVAPIEIMENYYGYMPGGFQKNPMQIQPETSEPSGYPAGGTYIVFHAKENPSPQTIRNAYYAYLNSNDELVSCTNFINTDIRAGFPSISIDPVTADPFVIWHNRVEADNTYDCSMSYHPFHLNSIPNTWVEPFIAIDNPEDSAEHTLHDDDEFIWPQMEIGESPTPNKRRVHIYSQNGTTNAAGSANYNILYGYVDFDVDDLNSLNELEFTFQSFPELDAFHYDDIARIFHDMVVSDAGKVAFIGWYDTNFYMLQSDDFGATFQYYETSGRWDYSILWDGEYTDILQYPSGDGGHFNAFFNEDNSKVVSMGAYGLNTVENSEDDIYMPGFFYPKIFNFSIENDELIVDIIDLYLEGDDPNDGEPMQPWYYDEFGDIGFVPSYPSWFYDGDFQDSFFHESLFKLTHVEKYFVAIWQDCEKHFNAYYDEPGYETWLEKPEIMFSLSTDNGVHWTQPAKVNANEADIGIDPENHFEDNYVPELNSMIPSYVYTANDALIIEETETSVTIELPLFFLDKFSYDSSVEGGMQYYTKIQLYHEFDNSDSDDKIISDCSSQNINLTNYPNPFNPETTISFDLTAESINNAEIIICNLKGQKIREYSISNNQSSIVWDGKDDNQKSVSSGIYFYKLKMDSRTIAVKRCILMK
ncbi:MAG: T9SS type A sorting domain-containing protein [Candidatus Cloacimonetes bacterium]|nr:T9SS type A sorting domain-containing protein [Candidatus Cloacimonadota bacterium]